MRIPKPNIWRVIDTNEPRAIVATYNNPTEANETLKRLKDAKDPYRFIIEAGRRMR